MEADNTAQLRNAGLIAEEPLPDEYYSFLEELSEDELETILRIKRRLDDAGIPVLPTTNQGVGIL